MENYTLSQNGRIINRITDMLKNVIAIADKFADEHRGDWTEVYTSSPKKRIYQRCDDANVNERA